MNVKDRLIGIYFRLSYAGFGENSEDDLGFIRDNEFKATVTDNTKNNGYDCDSSRVKELLEINKPYTLNNMDVGTSSSSLTLKEFPGINFNASNFEITL